MVAFLLALYAFNVGSAYGGCSSGFRSGAFVVRGGISKVFIFFFIVVDFSAVNGGGRCGNVQKRGGHIVSFTRIRGP